MESTFLGLVVIAVAVFAGSFLFFFLLHAVFHTIRQDFDARKALKNVSITSGVLTLFVTIVLAVLAGIGSGGGNGDTNRTAAANNDRTTITSTSEGRRRSSDDGTTFASRDDDSGSTSASSGSTSGGTSSRRRATDDASSSSRSSSTTTTLRSTSGGVTVTGSGTSFVINTAGSGETGVSVVEKWKYKDSRLATRRFTLELQLRQSDVDAARRFLRNVDRQLRGDQSAYAASLGVHSTGNDDVDTKNFYIAICRDFYKDDAPRLDLIVKGLEKVFSSLGFSQIDKFYFVTTLVQNIHYDDPGGEIGIFPPTLTLSENYGDCDTKSILAYVILEKLGFDVTVMGSEEYSHAMLGVNIPASGKYLTLDGKKYYFLEMTYPGWSLGEVASDCNNLRYWYAFKL